MRARSDYREKKPAPHLAAYVECLWMHGSSPVSVRVVPDTCVDLIFSREAGLQLVGSMTRPLHIPPAVGALIGFRLRAGAARALIGMPLHGLCDQMESFEPEGTLGQRLHDAESTDEAMLILEAALQPRESLSGLQVAISHLAANGGHVRVDEIAQCTGLSSRQFRRRCIEETGLSPKRLARIGRFRRASSRMAASRRIAWADLAAEYGYYDQAHLIHEFTEFSGLTPAAYQLELAG